MVDESLAELIGKVLAKEGNVGLNKVSMRDARAELMTTNLHHARGGYFIVVLVRTIRGLAVFLLSVGASLALEPLRLQRFLGDPLLAYGAFGDIPLFDFAKDRIAIHLVLAFDTGGSCKGTVTLDHLFRKHSCIAFDIVNVLGIVGQKLSLVLK